MIDEEDLIARETAAYFRRFGSNADQPSAAASEVLEDSWIAKSPYGGRKVKMPEYLIRLANVNGPLAEYRYYVDTNRLSFWERLENNK